MLAQQQLYIDMDQYYSGLTSTGTKLLRKFSLKVNIGGNNIKNIKEVILHIWIKKFGTRVAILLGSGGWVRHMEVGKLSFASDSWISVLIIICGHNFMISQPHFYHHIITNY